MLKNRKKLFIILFLFISLGITAWFIFFSYGTRWLEGRIDVAIKDLRQKVYVICYSTVKVSGNPLSIQAIIQNPHLKDPHGIMDLQGREVKITIRPWEAYTLHCHFLGTQKLILPQNPSFPLGVLSLEGAKGIVQLTSHGDLENLSFKVDHLVSFLGDQPQPLSLKDLSLNVNNIADPLNLKITLSTQLINIEKLFNRKTNHHPFTVNFVADLSGFKPQLPFPKSVAEWRDGGGVLEIRRFNIDWPPIFAEIEGTLTLDEAMYPLGSFSSCISGY